MAGKALLRRLAAARHGEVRGDGAGITTRIVDALAVLKQGGASAASQEPQDDADPSKPPLSERPMAQVRRF
jgi:hypothetical protein